MSKKDSHKPPFLFESLIGDINEPMISRRQYHRKTSRETCRRVFEILLTADLSKARAGAVAEQLGISTTTLRRRLREHNTHYQSILDSARLQRCENLLRERWLPGKCLAEELGYMEINSFYRAFQRWTGMNYSDFCLLR